MEAPSLSGLLDVGVPAPGYHDATELDDQPIPQGARNDHLQGEPARVSAAGSPEAAQVPQEQAAATQPLHENQPKQPTQDRIVLCISFYVGAFVYSSMLCAG